MSKEIDIKEDFPIALAENTNLSQKQITFIKELIETGSITKASQKAGIHRSTFYFWKKDESFKNLLSEIRRAILSDSITELTFLVVEAMESYAEVLRTETDPNDLKAQRLKIYTSNSLMDRLERFKEVIEFEDILAELKELAKKRKA